MGQEYKIFPCAGRIFLSRSGRGLVILIEGLAHHYTVNCRSIEKLLDNKTNFVDIFEIPFDEVLNKW